jgi:precorrin-6B methylase 2
VLAVVLLHQASFNPTPPDVVDLALRLARVGPADVVYDLGSGDGRIPLAAARDYGAKGVGIELRPELVKMTRERILQQGFADRVTIIQGDVRHADLAAADVVFMYLGARLTAELREKLESELPNRARVTTLSFPVPGWNTIREAERRADRRKYVRLFAYRMDARMARGPRIHLRIADL